MRPFEENQHSLLAVEIESGGFPRLVLHVLPDTGPAVRLRNIALLCAEPRLHCYAPQQIIEKKIVLDLGVASRQRRCQRLGFGHVEYRIAQDSIGCPRDFQPAKCQ